MFLFSLLFFSFLIEFTGSASNLLNGLWTRRLFFDAPRLPKCPRGFEFFEKTKSCYHIAVREMNFEDAVYYCQMKRGTSLVTIHSSEENEFVHQLCFKRQIEGSVWTGLLYVGNKWQWIDMSRNEFSNWASDMPVDSDKNTAGMMEVKNGTWQNGFWNVERRFVCKKPMWNDE